MSNVNLTIGGKDYLVACAEGEEDHVTGLGRLIDSKIAGMDGGTPNSEIRMLLFAALLLADEVHELRKVASGPVPPEGLDARLAMIAARLENLASHLEA